MGQDIAASQTSTSLAERPSLPGRALTDIIDWCLSACERDDQGKLHLRNMPSMQAREILSVRCKSLLASLKQHDRKQIAYAIMDMLASYDIAQIKQPTAPERKAAAAVYVRELQGVPTWAVTEACHKIRLGTAPDISHAYKPTPIQVRVLAVGIAQPWKAEALKIGEILVAPKYVEGPGEEERGRVAIKWRALADALKDGTLGDDVGLRNVMAEQEKAARETRLNRMAEVSTKAIEREWAAVGGKPTGYPVSHSLVKLIEAQKKAHADDTPHEPMVL